MADSEHPDLQAPTEQIHYGAYPESDIDDAIRARFAGVENSPPPTEEQKESVKAIRTATLILAQTIQKHTGEPRYKNTALTSLETAAMFAVKGVFQ